MTKRVLDKQSDQILQHDKHSKERTFTEGQHVMVRNLRPLGPKRIPGTILKQTGPLSFIVQVEHGLVWKRHVDHIHHSAPQLSSPPSSIPISTYDCEDNPFISPSSLDNETPHTNDNQEQTHPPTELRAYPSRNRHPPDRFM